METRHVIASGDTTKTNVVSQQYGIRWKHDVLNTDGSVWRKQGEVETAPNFSTAKALLLTYRDKRWPVELVMRDLVYTDWRVRG